MLGLFSMLYLFFLGNTFAKTHTFSSLSLKLNYSVLIKKENKSFLIYKEIHSGAVAKSYMRKGFLIHEEMCKYFPIYEE
jgi:hypothetical protein